MTFLFYAFPLGDGLHALLQLAQAAESFAGVAGYSGRVPHFYAALEQPVGELF